MAGGIISKGVLAEILVPSISVAAGEFVKLEKLLVEIELLLVKAFEDAGDPDVLGDFAMNRR